MTKVNNKNILIFLNTSFHVETALSIYETLKIEHYKPTILIDYNDNNNDFSLEEFLKRNNIQYLTTNMFDSSVTKESFHKMIIVTAFHTYENDNYQPIPNYNFRMEMFKDKAILVYHRANYLKNLELSNRYFANPKGVSVTQFSQKFGLNYFHQIENPLSEINNKRDLNSKIKFLLIGRFNLNNREISLFNNLEEIDQNLSKKIEIILIGQSPNWCNKDKFDFINPNSFKNIEINFKFNLNQLDFYNEVINCDFLLNLIDPYYWNYFDDRFTSNIHHIIAFSKPNISPILLNLIYNIPGLIYKKDFSKIVIEASNIDTHEYQKMINSFTNVKQNLRNHNSFIFKYLLNE